jgi:hypothetical protein
MFDGTRKAPSKPICYIVIDADRAGSGIRIRHHNPDAEFTSGQQLSALQVRFSLAEPNPPDGASDNTFDAAGYAQLRLAIDVTRDLHGYPRRLPQAVAAEWGLVALAGPHGPYNSVGTELLYRLGATPELHVYGPLVLHAAPDSEQYIGSLSDLQLRRLAEMTIEIGRATEGSKAHRGPTHLPTAAKENRTPWSRHSHALRTPRQRSHAVTAG